MSQILRLPHRADPAIRPDPSKTRALRTALLAAAGAELGYFPLEDLPLEAWRARLTRALASGPSFALPSPARP
jgi:hypothetical protein